MSKHSLIIDSLESGHRYQIYFTETVGNKYKAQSMGGFVDVFMGFKLDNQQLKTIWREQPPLDARSITRIEAR